QVAPCLCSSLCSNNFFFGWSFSPAPAYLTKNILTDPKFAMVPSDFRVFVANPAGGATAPGLASATDLDGTPRSSTNPTPGAYEFVSGASITPRALIGTTTTLTVTLTQQVPRALLP